MGDCIETVAAEYESKAAFLRTIAAKYPGCSARHYGQVSIWVVDMPFDECDSIHIENNTPLNDRSGKVRGYVLLFKNVGDGVNIAPSGHCIDLVMFSHYIKDRPKAMEEVIKLFKEKA